MSIKNTAALLRFAERKRREDKIFTVVLRQDGRELFINMNSVVKYDERYIYLKPSAPAGRAAPATYPLSCISHLEFCWQATPD